MLFEQVLSYEKRKSDWIEQCYQKAKSYNSRNSAINSLKMFGKFIREKYPHVTEEKIISEMLAASLDQNKYTQVYLFLNQFVQYMISNDCSPRSTRVYFAYVKEFCRYNGIRIYNEDRKQFIKLPKILKEKKKPLSYEIINKALDYAGKTYRAFILFAISSGMRIGEMVQLRVSDIDTGTNPVTITVRAEIAKMRVERTTFISKEAYNALKPILARRERNDLVFFSLEGRTIEDVINALEGAFSKIRKRAGLEERTATGRHQVTLHRFRDFFITKTDLIHEGLGHALAGHEKYMDEYNTYSDEDLRKFYLEVEPSLTMANDERNGIIIAQKDKQLKRQDSLEIELEKLKDWKRRMERIKN